MNPTFARCPWLTGAVLSALVLLLALGPGPAQARGPWPDKPLRFIIPYAAGSGVDVSMRPVIDGMARQLGQAVAVDNRPSAGGIIGSQLVARAPADGYTLGYGNIVTLSLNPSIFARLPYDPARDFATVGLISRNAYVLVARRQLPAGSFQQLVAHSKAAARPLSLGTSGVGSISQLAGDMLRAEAGLASEPVPYKSGVQMVGDMVNGQLDIALDNIAAVLPFIRDGQVRAIAVTSAERVSVLPEVPTLAESGVPGFDVVAWGGVVAPRQTPAAVIDRLNAALRAALTDPAVIRANEALSLQALPSSPQQMQELAQRETRRWADAARRAGIAPQ